jgi:hypothetical protein
MDLQIDIRSNLEKQWNDLVRKYQVGLPFEILRNEEPIAMAAVEHGDIILVISKWDTIATVQDGIEEVEFRLLAGDAHRTKQRIQKKYPGIVLRSPRAEGQAGLKEVTDRRLEDSV